jgi:hypothetical protein
MQGTLNFARSALPVAWVLPGDGQIFAGTGAQDGQQGYNEQRQDDGFFWMCMI